MTGSAVAASSGPPIARNAVSLLLAYVAPRVFTFVAAVAAARTLGTSDFGAYGTAAAFAVILSIVATLGMVPLLVREFAQNPGRAPTLLSAAHRVKTVSNGLMLACLVLLARAVGFSDHVFWAALLLGVAYAIGAYAENLAAYYQAVERMHVWTQASALFGLITGIVGATLVIATSSVVIFSAAPILGHAAALVWLIRRLPDSMRGGAPAQWHVVRRLLGSLAPFALSFVALTLYAKLDILLLSHWWPRAEVGRYAAAYKFVDITRALATVGAAAVYPRLARASAGSADDTRIAGSRLIELALLVTVPAASLLLLLRLPVILFVFGEPYRDAAGALGFLAAALPALALNLVTVYVLAAAHAMRRVALLYGLTLALNIVLNVTLIPSRGAAGAALAMLISEWCLALGALLTVRVLLGVTLRARAAWAVGTTAAACAALAGWGGALAPPGTAGVFLVAAGLVYGIGAPLDQAERVALFGALRRDAEP